MDNTFFITLAASISVMSVASYCEHLSMMTNAMNVDNRHHNKPWCMGTIMLYYYICSLVHLYFFCSAFDIFKSQVKAAITHAVKMPQRAASLADWFQPALCPSQILPRCLCVTFCFLKQKNRLRRLHVPKSCGKSVQQVKNKTHRIACALKMKVYSCTRSVGALLRVNISMQKHSQFFTDQR